MKKVMFAVLMAAAFETFGQAGEAQVPETPTLATAGKIERVDFAPELAAVTAQLKEKFDAGKTSETDLAENLSAINALILKYVKDGNREELARLYLLDAHIYADGLTDTARARAIWAQVVREFRAPSPHRVRPSHWQSWMRKPPPCRARMFRWDWQSARGFPILTRRISRGGRCQWRLTGAG
ncbi:MAG: hypothetical protein WBN22_04490 [Verrucomicrobiia bacterium]